MAKYYVLPSIEYNKIILRHNLQGPELNDARKQSFTNIISVLVL